MPFSLSSRRRFLVGAGLVSSLSLIGLGIWWTQNRQTVPSPDSPLYEEAWTSWTTGILALQTGDEKRAEAQMTRVTVLLPNDAAGHADLGLLFLRRGDLEVAATHLERASSLAPENARIQTLMALLESKKGNSVKTIEYLRRAVELSPSSLKARYALAKEIERADAKNLPEVQQILKQLSDEQPDNEFAAIELARIAAKSGDKKTLKDSVLRLSQNTASLPAEVQSQLRETQRAVTTNAPDTSTQLLFLSRLLATVPAFELDKQKLESPPEQVGELLESLLTLAPPSALAAPPDTQITFSDRPLPVQGKQDWDVLRAVYLDGAAAAKSAPSVPAIVALNASQLRLVDSKTAPIASFAATKYESNSLVVADWNNDYKPDLAIAGDNGVRLFAARTQEKFEDVTARTGLSPAILKTAYSGVLAYDVEADGDLDFVLSTPTGAPLVLRNNSDGTFIVTRPFTGIEGARAVGIGDFDSDADTDIAFLDAKGALRLYPNERSGTFRLLSVTAPPSAALSVADSNRDGVLDLILWGSDGTSRRLQVKTDGKTSIDVLVKTSFAPSGASRVFAADFDLNGGLDLLFSSGTKTQIFLSDEQGGFAPLALKIPIFVQDVADLNGDGRLDLVGLNAEKRAVTLQGAGVKPYNYLALRPRAKTIVGDGRINSFGVGGSVELRVGTLFQKQVITSPVVHFGIGPAKTINAARLLWPNGVAQAEFDLLFNQSVLAEQRLSGSCPFLWAWNGREMAFVKDCNWDSPLGLKINAQDTAGVVATEDWVKVRGDQLQPRNGILDLRLTADLWESHFFDWVSVLAVDRPKNQEMWVDERFAIPVPPLKVEGSGPLQPFKSVRDDRGRDVSAFVQSLDKKYLDVGRGKYQGITRPHFVELDVSNAPAQNDLWLIAEGWLHPTDSSINVALAQGKHAPPQSLSIQVPDGRGGWRVARSNLGFPSGKNKAITLDLSGLFTAGAPRRLRLASNLEIYWDKLSWATKTRATGFKIQRLKNRSAQLRFRGFSQIEARDASSPELPLSYAPGAGVGQKWSDLIGFHTRWGDVRELIQKTDDRYIIMNAGDEIALEFEAPTAPPPPGWTRDYVFITDGWTKDGNLNTGLSKTLLPLPSHKTPNYPTRVTRLQDDPVYQKHSQDWQNYHTRYVAPKLFNNPLLPPENSTVVTSARASEGTSSASSSSFTSPGGEGARVPVKRQQAGSN